MSLLASECPVPLCFIVLSPLCFLRNMIAVKIRFLQVMYFYFLQQEWETWCFLLLFLNEKFLYTKLFWCFELSNVFLETIVMWDWYHLHQASAIKMWDHCLFVLTPVSCSGIGLHQAASSIYHLFLEHWRPRTCSAHDWGCNSEQKMRKILAHAVLTFYFEETEAKWNTKQGHPLRMRKVKSVLDSWQEKENM